MQIDKNLITFMHYLKLIYLTLKKKFALKK